MPLPSRLAEWIEDESGKQMLSLGKLGYHQYGGFTLYQEPSGMRWHMIDSDGKEPLGLITKKDFAHRAIDMYNGNKHRVKELTRIEYERQQANQ
jgi:hypothetical protein